MRPFQEHRLHRPGIQVRMEVCPRRASHAVRWPGGRVIRMVGEMGARVHMEVLGRHHVRVVVRSREAPADRARHGGAPGHGQRAALAEVILYIDDDQCTHGANGILRVGGAPGMSRARVEYWNHNVHYQPVILRAVPADCAAALEVGCGDGMLARRLAERCTVVTAIDRDARMISVARSSTPAAGPGRVSFVEADSWLIPWPVPASTSPVRTRRCTTWTSGRRWLPWPARSGRAAAWRCGWRRMGRSAITWPTPACRRLDLPRPLPQGRFRRAG